MLITKKSLLAALALAASSYTASSFSGTLAIFNVLEGGNNSQVKIAVQDNLMRIETIGKKSTDEQPQVIFNSQTGELIIVNDVDKSFARIDKSTRDVMTQKMKDVKAKMEAQFAAMPPEQRQMMETMMKDSPLGAMFGKEVKKAISYKNTDKIDSVSGYACTIHEKIVDGKKHADFCVAPTEKIKGGKEIYKMMEAVMAVFKESSALMPITEEENPWMDMQALKGFPVMAMRYSQGKVTEKMSLKEISVATHDPKLFSAPAGYKENKIDFGAFN